MSALPWMPLYVDDYLGATGHLEVHEHGAYMLLIMHYWQKGGLPADEAMIRRIARLSPAQWKESRDVLAALFADGWKHKRIDEEMADAAEKYRKRVERARAGGQGRAAASKPQASFEQASSVLEAPHMPAQPTSDIEEGRFNNSIIDPRGRASDAPVVTLNPSPGPFEKFPADGSIAYSPWADVARREGRGYDVDMLASNFRKFCHMADIPFDRRGILKTFVSFCQKHKARASA